LALLRPENRILRPHRLLKGSHELLLLQGDDERETNLGDDSHQRRLGQWDFFRRGPLQGISNVFHAYRLRQLPRNVKRNVKYNFM
jgi:hypothetical protein